MIFFGKSGNRFPGSLTAGKPHQQTEKKNNGKSTDINPHPIVFAN
jgi:hypothetical protein